VPFRKERQKQVLVVANVNSPSCYLPSLDHPHIMWDLIARSQARIHVKHELSKKQNKRLVSIYKQPFT
jgi:hypothetical protein